MKIFAACLILGLPLPLLAADWPNWQGPNFNGISLEDEWDHEKIGNIIWKSKVGVGFAGVAVCSQGPSVPQGFLYQGCNLREIV